MQAISSSVAEYASKAVLVLYAVVALALAALYGLTRRETWVKPNDFERKQLDEGRLLEQT